MIDEVLEPRLHDPQLRDLGLQCPFAQAQRTVFGLGPEQQRETVGHALLRLTGGEHVEKPPLPGSRQIAGTHAGAGAAQQDQADPRLLRQRQQIPAWTAVRLAQQCLAHDGEEHVATGIIDACPQMLTHALQTVDHVTDAETGGLEVAGCRHGHGGLAVGDQNRALSAVLNSSHELVPLGFFFQGRITPLGPVVVGAPFRAHSRFVPQAAVTKAYRMRFHK
ncbi:hypothetical protein KBTX_01089 [wastewater metagenome]|uniref:Uncharacterized protein n=2 Tax=unclassified sequences TaxID=12908 RepID=A0A5B8R8E8_9ZZZZ|nr:hypothetical protein KBTEX_01089 [uncultured organism]